MSAETRQAVAFVAGGVLIVSLVTALSYVLFWSGSALAL